MGQQRNRIGKLESVRGFAAAVVLLVHAHFSRSGMAGILLSLGQEAVILFFVLSGFVVYYATLGRAKHPPVFAGYFLRRFRRIYPLFAVSLVLAYAAHCAWAGRLTGPNLPQLAGNMVMLQDLVVGKTGVWVDTYLDNLPLWSLAYEWWFYMLFFPIAVSLAIAPAFQRYAAAGVSAVGFVGYHVRPNPPCLYLSYFAIWWAGVELGREYGDTGQLTWRAQGSSIAILAGFTAAWGVWVARAVGRHQSLRLGVEPVLQVRHFADATLAVVAGLAWYKARFRGFRYTLAPFALLSPITYALYVCHVPTYSMVQRLLPGVPALGQLAASLAGLIPLAYLLEVRLQRRVNTAFDRMEAVLLGPSKVGRQEVAR
jgi:peptidoglycan/LPS O-acetylase OafA/YrhL